jgi:hypothetical protein
MEQRPPFPATEQWHRLWDGSCGCRNTLVKRLADSNLHETSTKGYRQWLVQVIKMTVRRYSGCHVTVAARISYIPK